MSSSEIDIDIFSPVMHVSSILVCQNCIVDTVNTLSVIQLFGEYTPDSLPSTKELWTFATLRGWKGKHAVKVTHLNPSKKETVLYEDVMQVENSTQIQFLINRHNIEFTESGDHIFLLYVDGVANRGTFLAVSPRIDM